MVTTRHNRQVNQLLDALRFRAARHDQEGEKVGTITVTAQLYRQLSDELGIAQATTVSYVRFLAHEGLIAPGGKPCVRSVRWLTLEGRYMLFSPPRAVAQPSAKKINIVLQALRSIAEGEQMIGGHKCATIPSWKGVRRAVAKQLGMADGSVTIYMNALAQHGFLQPYDMTKPGQSRWVSLEGEFKP